MNLAETESAPLSPRSPSKNRMAMCDNHRGEKGCQAIRAKSALHACGGCQSKFYCNAKCQRQDWTNGHSKECSTLAAKRQKELEKEKRREKKLLKAKKEAEQNHASFNASMTIMLMDSSSSESDGELYASRISLNASKASLASKGSKGSLKADHDQLHMSHGSIDPSNLAGSLSHLNFGGGNSKSKLRK